MTRAQPLIDRIREAAQEVFHVTYANRLASIAQHGLSPNSPRSIGAPGYDAHAKGRLFVTDFDGVRFWMSRAEDFANHNSDHPLTDLLVPVVLRGVVNGGLTPDELGSKDSSSQAWYLTKAIPAQMLDIWDGSEYIPLSDWESLDFSKAFDVQPPDDDEGEEDLEYFKDEPPFLPTEEES